mgnify:CR=1 FL=1
MGCRDAAARDRNACICQEPRHGEDRNLEIALRSFGERRVRTCINYDTKELLELLSLALQSSFDAQISQFKWSRLQRFIHHSNQQHQGRSRDPQARVLHRPKGSKPLELSRMASLTNYSGLSGFHLADSI